MARAKKERPDGLLVFSETLRATLLVPPEMAGRVVQAAAALFLYDTQPETPADLAEQLLLSNFTSDITKGRKRFDKVRARNQAIADNRQRPHNATNGNQWLPSAPTELNGTELSPTKLNEAERNAAQPRDFSREDCLNEHNTTVSGEDPRTIPGYITGCSLDE